MACWWDSSGNLLITDAGNVRVRKVTAATGIITTVAGNGIAGFSGDGGEATSASLFGPAGLALDSAGNVYIAEQVNQRVREVSNGLITTVAGNGTASFSGDGGPATIAAFDDPEGLALASSGNIYVADYFNHRIRLLTPVAPVCSYSVKPVSTQVAATGGNLTFSIQTIASCSWAVTDLPNWITVLGASTGSGAGAVTLVVSPNNSGAALSATIFIAGESITITQPLVMDPIISGVLDAASFAKSPNGQGSAVAPGSLVQIYATLPGASAANANTVPFLASLGGVSVTFNGIPAPLSSVVPTGAFPFVNAQVPFEVSTTAGPTANLVLTVNGVMSPGVWQVPVLPIAPGVFTTTQNGQGQAILVNLANLQIATPSNPIPRGGTGFFYATGLGELLPAVADGAASPASPAVATPIVLILGGHLKTGHTWSLQNRPTERTQNKSIYTLAVTISANIFSRRAGVGFILAAPGRRIRQRRDATGAPTSGAGMAGRAPIQPASRPSNPGGKR